MNDQLKCVGLPPDKSAEKFCKDNKDKSASDVCKEIQDRSKGFADVADDIVNAIWPIKNPFGANATSTQKIIDHLNNTMTDKKNVQQMNECIQSTTQIQSNDIEGVDENCLQILGSYMTPEQIFKLQSGGMKNITQVNKATSDNMCKINLALETLTKMDSSIDNSALQAAINKATGLMSNSDSNQDTCIDINNNMSACTYITQKQCCDQHTSQTQSNLLNSKCTVGQIQNILQSNNADSKDSCLLSAQASITTDFASTIKNTISQDAKNTSEGLTLSFGLILLFIFLLIVGIPIAIGRSIIKYIGGILIIIGFVFFILWLSSINKEQTIPNAPFSGCQGVKGLSASLARATFGEVKDRVKQDDVVGYDFFIDVGENQKGSDINGSSILDTQLGSVFYITQLPSSSACDPIDPDKMSTVSYKKGTQNLKYLAIAISTTLAGIIIIVYKLLTNDKPKATLGKKPGLPIVKPGLPIVKPGLPIVKPGLPIVKPGLPSVKPGQPTSKGIELQTIKSKVAPQKPF